MNYRAARVVGTLALFSISAAPLLAQQDRIAGPLDRSQRIALKGNIHPNAEPRFDAGPVDSSLKLNHVMVMLKPSAAQQADLDRLLAEQQDRSSPNYHAWLTPEQFGDRFGLGSNDIGQVVSWLQSEGLAVDGVSRARNWIWFSGTAGQVQAALRTEIHRYSVNGESHFANASEPSVPAVIEPLVSGIRGLDDFHLKSRLSPRVPLSNASASNSPTPKLTNPDGSHLLAPDDFATIYNLVPLYTAGYDGSGQRIVVAGESAVDLADIRAFRSLHSLPQKDPQILLVPGTPDPGFNDAMGEADLDIEWAGAVARNANIIYVYSPDVVFSVFYAIEQNFAPIITLSFGSCEQQNDQATLTSTRALAQQANAQGITWLAATGDSGAAGCDPSSVPGIFKASLGLNVAFPASIPEVTAVGGTQFNDATGNYWAASNSSTFASALSYIPEQGWNESGRAGLSASGGGLSNVFNRPLWQAGPGVPSLNFRAVPDVALSAAAHDAYVVISGGLPMPAYGTSAATPSFAGILALVNQYQELNGVETRSGQGNINPNLYSLAQTTPGVFHDITAGDNIVGCSVGTPNCSSGTLGYAAGPGYDLVTGLGSVDGFNLAINMTTQWRTPTISFLSPTSAVSGGGQFALVVNGSGFDAASVVQWSGTSLPTTFVNGTELLATVNPSLISAVGSASITVQGSKGTSSSVLFAITASQLFLYTNPQVTTTPPPASGKCVIPPSTPTVTVNDTVYLYFTAIVTPVDLFTDEWLAPNGVVIPGDAWPPLSSGIANFCFPDSNLPLQGALFNTVGNWQIRVYDQGSLLFSVPFTVTEPGNQTTPLAHAADGNAFKTTVLLTNASTVQAPYTLRFNDEQGNIPSTRFELETGSLTGVIPAGGSATIRTAGLGPATINGWAELTAPASVGGSVIYSQKNPNLPSVQEGTATIGTAASQHFFLPFDNTNKASTGVAFTNPGATAANNIQITFHYSDGTTSATTLQPLASRGHVASLLSVPGKKGVAEVTSDAALLTVVFRANSTGAFTALDGVPASTTATVLPRTLAHAADGDAFKTTVLLTNAGSAPAQYTLRFDDNQGNVPSSRFELDTGSDPLTGTIPAAGSVTIRTAGLGPQTVNGWAELSAPASVGGSVIYSQQVPALPSLQEGTATIVASGSQHFFMPFDNTAGAITGVAITNPGALAANTSVTIRYSDGTSETTSYPQLASRNHQAFVLASQFPNTANQSGVAEFTATSALSVVEFRFNSTGAFTSLGIVAP
jgi:hypothetical protein